MDETQAETIAHGGGRPVPTVLQTWGPFERLTPVGHGAFGEVYRAFDVQLQREVALKLLHPSGREEADVDALLREARAMARVRHPNVLPIHGVDQHGGRVGFWSDFVRGRTLTELLAVQGPFGPREAAALGLDICRAVSAVHAAGLLHRDIKSSNIMREEGGRLLLMDFGLTHEAGVGAATSGTPVYMAPETLHGQPASVASDIYAIGVLLYHLLTGRYPVEGRDMVEIGAAHQAGARTAIFDLRPDLPDGLVSVIERATHVDPQRRYGSAGHMASALAEALGAAPPTSVSAEREIGPVRHAGGRRPAAVAVAALALALAIAGGVTAWWRSGTAAVTSTASTRAATPGTASYARAHDLLEHYYRPHAIETAIPLLEAVVADDPQFAPALADLARANYLQFTQQRDPAFITPAREFAQRAVAAAPGLASPHVTLGLLYTMTAQPDLATHELDEALRLDRFSAAAHLARAELYKRQGRTDAVEPVLRQAVALAPDDWAGVTLLGEHYLDQGRWADAVAQYRRAITLAPDNPRAQNNLGLAYRGQDQLAEAATAFRQALALEPTYLRFRNLGMVLAEAGDYAAADAALRQAIDARPDHYRAWGLLAWVTEQQGGTPMAVADLYQQAIQRATALRKETPRDEYLLADLGQYYAALGQEEDAAPLLAQAAALAPEVPEVLYEVAVGYERLQRRDEALRWLAQARTRGYPAGAINRNPLLLRLRADPRYGARDSVDPVPPRTKERT